MITKTISRDGELSLGLTRTRKNVLRDPTQYSLYSLLFIEKGSGIYKADFGSFAFTAPVILFSTPLQTLQLEGTINDMVLLQFHGDYYCIEYHKKEVACNGILFNNIYIAPFIALQADEWTGFHRVIDDLDAELAHQQPDDAVIRAYLQLVLAKATSVKKRSINSALSTDDKDEKMEDFKALIEQHYRQFRQPSQYADLLHLSPDTLARRCKQYFRKAPTELIQERVIQEAKTSLHLTRKSIKEIAHSLSFEDEHYFSRFFKKITGVSPQTFRIKTGISIVADLSTSKPE